MTQRSSAYTGRTVTFATMHGKELLARDAFHHILGATVTAPRALDTDQFGNSKQDSYKRTTRRPAERSHLTQGRRAGQPGDATRNLTRRPSLLCHASMVNSDLGDNSSRRGRLLRLVIPVVGITTLGAGVFSLVWSALHPVVSFGWFADVPLRNTTLTPGFGGDSDRWGLVLFIFGLAVSAFWVGRLVGGRRNDGK